MRKFEIDKNIFENIDTEEKAYWLGFIAADGCVTNGGKHGRQFDLRVNLGNEDYKHLIALQKFIKTNKPIQSITKLHKKNQKYYYSCLLRICSKKIVTDLITHSVVPAKSKIIKFPCINESLQRHYIRGLFDGDGSWSKSRTQLQFSIVGANFEFLKNVSKTISTQTGLCENKITCDKKTGVFRVNWNGNNNCEKIFDWVYKDVTVFLDRKFEKSKCLKSSVNRNKNRGQKIYELDNSKEIIKIHKNATETAKYHQMSNTKICAVLNGKYPYKNNLILIREVEYINESLQNQT